MTIQSRCLRPGGAELGGSQMASFDIEPAFGAQLRLDPHVRGRGGRTAGPGLRGRGRHLRQVPSGPRCADPTAPAAGAGPGAVVLPSHRGDGRPGVRAGAPGLHERDPGPLGLRPDHLRLSGTRFRQRRDPGPLRHPGPEGAVPPTTARGTPLVVLLDDGTPGRGRPVPFHHPGRGRRGRVGHHR